jgi:FkbM family methyltransferase
MLRTLLERLSRKRVIRRRMPARLGGDPVMVSPDSALRYWKWNLDACEKMLFDFAEEFVRSGDTVWDVGANVGMFTFAGSYRAGAAGRVVAIEADIFLADLLRRSASLASIGRANVIVLPVAVSDSLGIMEFHIAKRGRCSNYLASLSGGSQTGGVRETVQVMTVTLDWLMERLPPPRVIKIDVEGAEALVLAGANTLISKVHPVILCEISEQNVDTCSSLLKSQGYTLYDMENRSRGPIEKAAFNTLAVFE